MIKLISWNVNGLRACITKGFLDFVGLEDADIICVQETKMQESQADFTLENYYRYYNSADKKGYSGTAIFTRKKPISAMTDIGIDIHSHEGRVITLEYDSFFLVNVYTPNAKRGLERIEYRVQWEDDFREYVKALDEKKPVIICGDLNVAHNEIDLKNAKANAGNAGFSDEERGKFNQLLSAGFTDSFRLLYPELTGAYTWWSYMFKARQNNAGWRIDYFLTSSRMSDKIKSAVIYADVLGSDHCPVGLEYDDII